MLASAVGFELVRTNARNIRPMTHHIPNRLTVGNRLWDDRPVMSSALIIASAAPPIARIRTPVGWRHRRIAMPTRSAI